jgi:hypothetical protein
VARATPLKPHRLPADGAGDQRNQWVAIVVHPAVEHTTLGKRFNMEAGARLSPNQRERDYQPRCRTGEANVGHVAFLIWRHLFPSCVTPRRDAVGAARQGWGASSPPIVGQGG